MVEESGRDDTRRRRRGKTDQKVDGLDQLMQNGAAYAKVVREGEERDDEILLRGEEGSLLRNAPRPMVLQDVLECFGESFDCGRPPAREGRRLASQCPIDEGVEGAEGVQSGQEGRQDGVKSRRREMKKRRGAVGDLFV